MKKIDKRKKKWPNGCIPRDGPKKKFSHKSFKRKWWGNRGKKKGFWAPEKKKNKKKGKQKGKPMQDNDRKKRKMKEHQRKWKMKENERKWKKMKENRVLLQKVDYSLTNLESRPGGSLFSPCEEQTFSECALFPRNKGEPPRQHPRATREGTASDLRKTWIWRREISIHRTEMKRRGEERRGEERRGEERRGEERRGEERRGEERRGEERRGEERRGEERRGEERRGEDLTEVRQPSHRGH